MQVDTLWEVLVVLASNVTTISRGRSSFTDAMEPTRKPTLPMFEEDKPKTPSNVKPHVVAEHCGNNGAYSDAYLEFSEGMAFQKTGDYKRAVQCYSKVGIYTPVECERSRPFVIDTQLLAMLLQQTSITQSSISYNIHPLYSM